MKRNSIVGLIAVLLAPLSAFACSWCSVLARNQNTLSEELERAQVVFYGRALESSLDDFSGARPGAGRTRFQIERVLKDEGLLANKKNVVLERYVTVRDAKDPPRFLVFCAANQGRLDWYYGPAVGSEAVVDYLIGAGKARQEGRTSALKYYFRYFDSSDSVVAGDAYREFGRASDQEVSDVRRFLPADKIRSLIENQRTRVENLPMLAFLLGGCGGQRDAQFLRGLIDRSDDRMREARDGLMTGYLSLEPRAGWDLIHAHVADAKRPLLERIAAVRALRVCYTLKLGDYRQEALRCYAAMVPDGNIADVAIDDLRRWQLWDLSDAVLAQYDKQSHAAPITRRTILRYALCCPQAPARQFVEAVRLRDPQTVREIEEGLQLDRGP